MIQTLENKTELMINSLETRIKKMQERFNKCLEERLTEWIKKTRSIYMLSTRDPPRNTGHIQTESEGLEKDIPQI